MENEETKKEKDSLKELGAELRLALAESKPPAVPEGLEQAILDEVSKW